jgi:hypothetical protein
MKLPDGIHVDLRGMVQGMRQSFRSFALACCWRSRALPPSVAQFHSFLDPLLVPRRCHCVTGVLLTLLATGST